MRDIVNETNNFVPKLHEPGEVNQQEERKANPKHRLTGQEKDDASSNADVAAPVPVPDNDAEPIPEGPASSSSSWDFFMKHCREFDMKDPGLCVRIDRKVKKKLDLAKARFSLSVSEKGMASAIILHFLEENDALFDIEPEED